MRKVPVPKLPGAVDTYKTLTGKFEKNMVLTRQPTEQLKEPSKEQGRGQTSDADLGKNNSDLLSQGANHPSASTPEQDALLLTEDNVVDYVADNVASTQIDIEPAGDICHTSQEETSIPLQDSKGEVCQGDSLMNPTTRENKAKEAETGSSHLKEDENAEVHSQTSQQILQGTAGAAHPIQDHPFSPVSVKEVRQYSDHLPTEPDPSLTDVSTVGKSTLETHFAISAPQEINCSLDNSIIEEIVTQDVKELTNGAKEDCSKCKFGEQMAPRIDTTFHDKCNTWPVQNDQPEEHEIHKSKSVINLLEDPIVPALDNLSSSFTERRILAHLHTLKQLVASKVSLVNMEFGEDDLTQAAKLYDNLNATACFYTTALRLLSKADWQEPVDFEDHIVHQAMIAAARGWTTAVGVKTLPFDKHYLALSMATLPLVAHGEVKRTFDSIVATLPSPFREKASSKVAFTCRVCGKKASHEVPTSLF